MLNPVISKLSGKLVVLASASPRRLEILTNVGLQFEVVPSWFKETLDKSLFKTPQGYAVETAKQKALEVARRMPFNHLKTPDIVIGADTIVTVDGLILEKPVDKQDAYRMLSRLSGKEHSVFTGVAIVFCQEKEDPETEYRVVDFFEETKVKFSQLSEEMLWEYIHSGEPMDKAGGYGIQALGGMLVEYVHGDFLNVVGFPLNHFCKELGNIFNSPTGGTTTTARALGDASVGQFNSLNNLPECVKNGGGEMCDKPSQKNSGSAQDRNIVEQKCALLSVDFPRKIVGLLDGFKASKTLFTASKLKVFDLLACPEGLTASEVADKIFTSVQGTERLLEALVSLDLLEKLQLGKNAVYTNTEDAKRYLMSTSELSLRAYILHCDSRIWPLFTHLEHGVREGTGQQERAFGRKPDANHDSCYNTREMKFQFMEAMHCVAKVTGRDLATSFDLSRFRTACDLGGCTGAFAYAVTRAHPELSVVVFDLPAVTEISSHFRPQDQQSERVTFVAGDFLKDALPKANLYILARVLHDLPEEKVHILLSKLSEICSPGCGVLVCEIFLVEGRQGGSRALLQALSMTEGIQRSAADYSDLLKGYGFTQIHIRHTGNFLDAMLCVKQ